VVPRVQFPSSSSKHEIHQIIRSISHVWILVNLDFFSLSFQSYWDWLPLELNDYELALAKAQHKIDLERKKQWKEVISEF